MTSHHVFCWSTVYLLQYGRFGSWTLVCTIVWKQNTEVVCCLWKKREGREEKEKKRQERGEKREGSGRERRKRGTSRASKLVIRHRLSYNALTSNLEPEGLRPGTEERSFHLLWCRRVCVQILKKKTDGTMCRTVLLTTDRNMNECPQSIETPKFAYYLD